MLWTNLHGDILYERLSDEVSTDEVSFMLNCNPDDIIVQTCSCDNIVVFIYQDDSGKTIYVIYDPDANPERLIVRYTDCEGRSHLPMSLDELW